MRIRIQLARQLSVATLTGSAMAASLLCGNAPLAATLPVPCAAGSCIANKTPGFTTSPGGFVTYGQATAAINGNTLTVNQSSAQAILNWSSFNVSADGTVVFQQPGANSVALNKIFQNSPSAIFGQLSANGQVYLINPNGFVFGAHSSVNVAGLIASSLGLTQGDNALTNGFVTAAGKPVPGSAFSSDGRLYVTDASGNPVLDAQGNPQPVQVVVQPGAQMTAAGGGRVMLAGQQVVNGGNLSAPDGQIVLAAGQTLYLAASADSSLRGLIVEVNNNPDRSVAQTGGATPDPNDPAMKALGSVTNQAGATLSTPRGNVSLIGLAVNQSGRISATTSVSANGSVILQAADGGSSSITQGVSCQNNAQLCGNVGGTLKIGATSQIDVLPDLSDTSTAVVGQAQLPSTIALSGQQIDIEGGKITAPGGTLNAVAAANPDIGLVTHGNAAAQIRVAAGTDIDLSGSDAVVPMSSNLLSIQLRSNELEDDPVQRGGPLQTQTVIVDIRDGKPAIISESSWQSALQAVQENILQRTSNGGKASFLSEGDVVVNNGATIDVSGGKWTYTGGVTQTSELIGKNGQLYDVTTANPSLAYTGVLNPTYTQSFAGFGVQITQATPGLGHYENGYIQGFSAGSVNFAAPAMALQGNLVGTAVNGPYQRSAASIPAESLFGYMAANNLITGNGIATGGTLIIGDAKPGFAGNVPDYFSPAVIFANDVSPIVVAEGAPLTAGTLQLATSYITNGGFQQTEIFSNSTVALPAGLPLNLGVGGSLLVDAAHISINSDIQALSGTIDLLSGDTYLSTIAGVPRTGIDIASGVTLDVRGQWTNDSQYAAASAVAPAYQDGGKIELSLTNPNAIRTSGGELTIGDNVNFEASGGAWIQANSKIVGGKGGQITLDASPYASALQIGTGVSLDAFGVQGALGGSFSLSAPRIDVVQGNGTWASAQQIDDLVKQGDAQTKAGTGAFTVGSALFSQYGFSSVTLNATAPVIFPDIASSTGTPVPDTTISHDTLTVEAGTTINAQAQSWQLDTGYLTRASGGSVEAFTRAATLPVANQNPFQLTLETSSGGTYPQTADVLGDLDIQAGTSITLNPNSKSTLSLISDGSLLVNGTLRAPGGIITAQITAPQSPTDPGYVPDQHLDIGSQAVLDVSGATILTPNTQNRPLGTVLPGGTVNLQAFRGDVITEAGSLIDIAGGSSILDVQVVGGATSGSYQSVTVGSAGGTLLVQSAESVSLLGGLTAAGGASSVGKLAGGQLEVDLSGSFRANAAFENQFPTTAFTIELVDNAGGSVPTASYGNLAVLGVAQLEQSGIDFLKLQADNTIQLANNTALSLDGAISLDAPTLSVSYGTSAALAAPYVTLTDSNTRLAAQPTATTGTGALNISADQLVLAGVIALQGVANATFTSSGDVEMEPANGSSLSGSLALVGNLNLNASRIYPATLTSFTIDDPTGDVTIGKTSASPGTPLSAGGSLVINANNITSSGTLLAPFGQIELNASSSLSLLSGSVTSVSGAGLTLPFGQTTLGETQWVYSAGGIPTPINGIPDRKVSLTAPSVTLAGGATVDVSGGGDLSAYEWVPGTGGSVDALGTANATSTGMYAILPSTRGQYASYDVQEFLGSNVGGKNTGQSIYLSGVPGLPDGYYPLLPARYALLPGALLVQAQPNYTSLASGRIGTLTDGTAVYAGYTSFGNTGLQTSSGYTGFTVRPGSYGQTLATYNISDASTYFAAAAAKAGTTAALPADAGTLLIAASSALNALGRVNTAAGTGGAGATIEISSTDLTVTQSSQITAATGVSISAPVLQSWGAGNLLLGGEFSDDGSLQVTANTVTVAAGAAFSAGQVLAVADQSIDVQSGAVVASTSGLSGSAPKTMPQPTALNLTHQDPAQTTTSIVADNTAALLAVSDSSLPIVTRSPTNSSAGAGGSGMTPPVGSVQIDSGATLSSRGAIALDAPGSVSVAGTLNGPGANVSLASTSIAFVGSSGFSSDTLVINPGLASQLQSLGGLWLTSAGNIDLLAPLTLGVGSGGSPTLGTLALTASAINNQSGGAITFGAHTLTLQGNGTDAPDPTSTSGTTGGGTLTLVADNLNVSSVGPLAAGTTKSAYSYTGNLAINGNTQTTLQVGQAVTGQGTNVLGIAGNVTLSAGELTAASHSNTALNVPDGTLTIQQNGTAAKPSSLVTSLGGELSLTASQIQDSGSIIVPGGQISLTATQDPNAPVGSALPASNIVIASGAVIDTSGITVSAGNQTIGAAGGIVNITAAGDLTLANAASINVSGAGDSPAGFLALTGGGTVTLSGSLAGNAAADATGGSFWLDAGQLSGGLPGLVSNLTSGGFTNQVNVRVRTGDLDAAAGTTLTANQITLTADNGAIDIAGILNAPSAGTRGSIGLFASGDVTLESTGQLLANGSGSTGRGGEIELSTVNGAIALDSGSVISASGQAQMGSLLLRAPALVSNGALTGDVAIGNIGSNISGLGIVTVEPVLPTYENVGDFTQDFSQIQTDVTNFLANALPLLHSRLDGSFPAPNSDGSAKCPCLVIEPGVVVDAQNDLNLGNALDLYAAQLGAPIDLTVRSSGSLTISSSISDGVVNGNTVPSSTAPVSSPYVSSTLRFVAGADLDSANPLATLASKAADLTLTSGALVTTATGDIDLVAAHDVSVQVGASAYTTGDYTAANPGVAPITIKLGQNVPINFLTNGGNVIVNAGHDVIGQDDFTLSSVSSWQGRNVKTVGDTTLGYYGTNLTAFNQNPWSLATFGGGDLNITAGHDVTKVSAAVADSLALAGSSQVHFASGGMTVNAGHDVTNAQFFVANGVGTLNAGHSFAVDPNSSVGSLFNVETARVSLWAQDSITVEGVINPTLLQQPQAGGNLGSVSFFTYDHNSAFSAQSSSGDVSLPSDTTNIATMIGLNNGTSNTAFNALPANLRLVSLTQDIVQPTGTLFPSATGQLQLFAGRDIFQGDVIMSDAPASDYQTASSYSAGLVDAGIANLVVTQGTAVDNFKGDLHGDDSTSASIVAGRDINGLNLSIPKQADVLAGRDVLDLQYIGQNLGANDLTVISAGRDFTDTPAYTSTGLVNTNVSGVVSVGGPGQVDILAGRNIDLGFSVGVITDGNLVNPNLPSSMGSSITMIAGLGQTMDDSGFVQKVIETSSTYQQQLVSYVQSVNGQQGLSLAQAEADFGDFATGQQQAFVDKIFFHELDLSGKEANDVPGAGYERGYAAIDALFPGARDAAAGVNGKAPVGNLNLTYSQVYTLSGGGITLMVPGGDINVGLASAPAGAQTIKQPYQLGIVAQGTGDVDIYSEGDVNVNSSRIFTLGGGNIVIWSNAGNIDAGNGAKTSLSVPPPTYTTDSFGNPELVFGAAVAGSGIRTIQEGSGTPAGDVNLIAPIGAVNAGDAGIGAAGNINLAAAVVTGASNINFGGTATGVPPAVANVTASVSGAASAASATANTASSLENVAGKQEEAAATTAAVSWLDVFVSGLGEENCKPEDQDCLERQKKDKESKE